MTKMLFNINNNTNNNSNINRGRPTRRLGIPLPQQTRPTNYRQAPVNEKQYWGRPTWIFLHTLAEKVNEEHFDTLKTQLYDFIIRICHNLPCPICANHARQYMKNVNFNNITTKQGLKKMLFDFHNTVNQRKSYPQFKITDLDTTYSNANLIQSYNNFIRNYHMNGAVRYMVETANRKKLVSNLSNWFKTNLHYFAT
jgi:hypothetical protein